jgi:4-hydroxybutyrate dehydrogenase/sulfolactaldehyde 3-reductase
MLPNAALVKRVLFGESGVNSTMSKDALLVDMSTIHPFEMDALVKEMSS